MSALPAYPDLMLQVAPLLGFDPSSADRRGVRPLSLAWLPQDRLRPRHLCRLRSRHCWGCPRLHPARHGRRCLYVA